ncbi:MAG: PilZ domain-containing protein [Pseudomonadota bacterium]|nr:PilZ domain-containing protein [Pseudomonadota bacterium]
MIPRSVKRLFDQRDEERANAEGLRAELHWRGQTLDVGLANLSSSGAMVICDAIPHIGERVALMLPDRRAAPADVSWVRDGRVGIHFAAPLA